MENNFLDKIRKFIFDFKISGRFTSNFEPLALKITLFGIKITISSKKCSKKHIPKSLLLNCDIEDIDYILSQEPIFTHMVGIVISRDVKIGKNVLIRQNVTLGHGSLNEERNRCYPHIGNNVQIGANALLIGGINIGNNAIIGGGCVVTHDVPENAVVVGNPAKIIKYISENKSISQSTNQES